MHRLIHLWGLALLIVLATGCGLIAPPAPTPVPTNPPPTAVPTVAATAAPTEAATAAATAAPTAAGTAAPTAAGTAAPTAGAQPSISLPTLAPGTVIAPAISAPGVAGAPKRINFAPGGTTAFLQGAVAPNGVDRYVLRAQAGQTMSLNLVTAQGPGILAVVGADGRVLLPASANATSWTGNLPSTQDYTISVQSTGNTASNYALQVTIPPVATIPSQSTPRRITFAPGATTATVQGNTATAGMDRFVLRVLAGQTMTVNITSAQNNVILIIYGADGNVLISDHAGATTWTGQIPSTQDYIIDTRSVGSNVVPFTLKVTVPPLTSGPTTAAPRRITFPPGGTSASLQGSLAVNGIDHYVIRALAGQRMTVSVTSAQGTILFSISGADGNVLKSSAVAGSSWTGTLPTTQDYNIALSTPTGTLANYTLVVSIPPGP